MKKVFYVTAAIALFGVVSCQKCQECTVETYQESNGYTQQTSSTTEEYCGDQYNDAPEEGTVSQNYGSVNQSVTTTCVDK